MSRLTNGAVAAALALAVCGSIAIAAPRAAKSPAKTQTQKAQDARRLHGPGLHHIAIKVADFDRSLRFYTQTLGMKRVFGWGEGDSRGAMLDMGDHSYIEMFAGGKPRKDPAPDAPVMHIALRSGDPDGMYKKAIEAGAKSQREPGDVTINGDHALKIRIAFVVGFDGEVIEFFKNDEF